MSGYKEMLRSLGRQAEAHKRPASCESMKSDQSMGPPLSFKRHDLPYSLEEEIADSPASSCESMKSDGSMDFPVSFKRSEKKREDPSAKRRVLTKLNLLEESLAFKRAVKKRENPSAKRREIRKLKLLEKRVAFKRSKSIPEEERADSPASSCGSMKSDRSMGHPLYF